jgi:hypothetical protein
MDGRIGGGGSGNPTSDAVTMLPTPDHSMIDDASNSRPSILSNDVDSIQFNKPSSALKSQLPPLQSSQLSSMHLSQSSPPPSSQLRLPPLPPLSPLSPPTYTSYNAPSSLSQTKSPSAPLNPFYPPINRASTPPMSSPAEDSPIVSPAKRFSSGEVKPPFSPNSPRQPLTDEDRAKFTQVHLHSLPI